MPIPKYDPTVISLRSPSHQALPDQSGQAVTQEPPVFVQTGNGNKRQRVSPDDPPGASPAASVSSSPTHSPAALGDEAIFFPPSWSPIVTPSWSAPVSPALLPQGGVAYAGVPSIEAASSDAAGFSPGNPVTPNVYPQTPPMTVQNSTGTSDNFDLLMQSIAAVEAAASAMNASPLPDNNVFDQYRQAQPLQQFAQQLPQQNLMQGGFVNLSAPAPDAGVSS